MYQLINGKNIVVYPHKGILLNSIEEQITATTWINPKNIILSERGQPHRAYTEYSCQYYDLLETAKLQGQKTSEWSPGAWGSGKEQLQWGTRELLG